MVVRACTQVTGQGGGKEEGFIPPGECPVISRHGKVVAEANSGGTRAAGESMLGSLS